MAKKKPKDDDRKLSTKRYEKELRKLQAKLCMLQEWVKHKGLRIIIIFEGRDAAGKGGTIRAITERVSPRVFQVKALPAPSDREKSQLYLQRYIQHFPAAGEIVIFDRSWYNRAGVEYVMGFCSKSSTSASCKTARSLSTTSSMEGSSSSRSGLRPATRSRSDVLKPESRIRCGSGSSARWTCPRAAAGSTIRGRAT
jgi:polyphosphate kinase 2 (PPK2 family)